MQWLGIPPRGRLSLNANDVVGPRAFGASFLADQDVIVERSTTWSPGQNGETTIGFASRGWRDWYFAEGSTRRPSGTSFVLFNPGQGTATAQIRFAPEAGEAKSSSLSVPALGRVAVNARDLVPAADFATTITADRPVIAERAYASSGDGLYGTLGYTPARARTESHTWYFADGNTAGGIETYFVLANLTDQPARVEATYFGDPERRQASIALPAFGRQTVRANDVMPDQSFAARFAADQDIVVERTAYFPGGSGFSTTGATP
jgi:hypothetical protein